MAERMLVSVAHPDDESFGTGSIIARAVARGVPTVVCCATRGEAGEHPDGLAPEAVGRLREEELRFAAALLGAEEVRVLGWTDSGMEGTPGPGTLVAADPGSVTRRLVEVIEEVRPTVVVTLCATDGHRDHEVIRDCTLAAVDRARWQARRAYLSCLPRSLMAKWVERLRQVRPASEYVELEAVASPGTPEHQITTIVDSAEHYDLRWRAIAAHASQESPYQVMPEDLRREFLATDWMRRVRPSWPGGPLERDFLARSPG